MFDNRWVEHLIRVWKEHAKSHRHCYYEESGESMQDCPGRASLRHFLEANGVDTEGMDRIFGYDLDEPTHETENSAEEFSADEFSATEFSVVNSLAERRAGKEPQSMRERNSSRYYQPTTDAALRARAQRAGKGSVENEQTPWEVEAMEYFSERLNKHDEHLHNISMVLGEVMETLGRIEDALAERSEANLPELFAGKTEEELRAAVSEWLNRLAGR